MPELTSPGRVLGGRYRLVEPLARGGMATVWVAEDPVLSRRVAVKILRADLAADEAVRLRFRREAVAAAKLGHPNIVATYDTGDDEGIAYIVMELVSGSTLRQLIDEHGGLPVDDVLRIGIQVADALEAAHREGLVHRDVKPANVLVPLSGPVKVTDFGIAKATGITDLTRTGTVMGTARYLSPEQVNGDPTDARTDVYALGLLLYEMLCAQPPFGGDSEIATAMARLTTTAPAVRARRPDVPKVLDDVVHRCLARDPAARYASAGATRNALEACRLSDTTVSVPIFVPRGVAQGPLPAASTPTDVPIVPVPTHAAPPRANRTWIWVLLVALVAAGAGVGAYLALRDDGKTALTPVIRRAGAIKTTGAHDFDPLGDQEEDPAHVGFAVDGNPKTSWSTEMYVDFQRDKAGVGLRIDLDGTHDVRSVTVTTQQSGWSGAIYVSDQPGQQLSDWGTRRANGDNLDTKHTFDLAKGARGRYVLLWITALPNTPDGQRLEVAEVKVA